ncbi:hypothetical protein PROFUN_03358 [Planoprotostelium fungivorum]|uniref:Uncharacterized protein n=1 Tax=Planoprotostelium fungivorum TaxID=1890364 RepID=A0A2P6NWC1_9EUKA|nr:hypothetical protein PROFUN_03358 [Planoprotostelium fungivorum]
MDEQRKAIDGILDELRQTKEHSKTMGEILSHLQRIGNNKEGVDGDTGGDCKLEDHGEERANRGSLKLSHQ